MPVAQHSLDFDQIKDRFWKFFHESGHVAGAFFQFLPDGAVGGYSHDNERYWAIENGVVCLLDSRRVVTVRFEDVRIRSGKLFLKGPHIPSPDIVLCLEEQGNERARFNDTQNALSQEIAKLGWSIGDHTYGVPEFFEKGMSRLIIGKYCSIGGEVKIAFGNHRTDTSTTYPFKSLGQYWMHVPPGIEDHATKGDVVIGHDVWIGNGVFIGSGVSIGSGAVLGARSVIAKDVPPYAIVVGNPARIIRHRFPPAVVAELLALAWWDLDDDTVDRLLPQLMSTDTPALLQALRRLRPAAPAAPATVIVAPAAVQSAFALKLGLGEPPPVPEPTGSRLAHAARRLGFGRRS